MRARERATWTWNRQSRQQGERPLGTLQLRRPPGHCKREPVHRGMTPIALAGPHGRRSDLSA